MTTATSGRGGHGGYGRTGFLYGFKLHAVIDDHGMLVRFAIVPGREGDPPAAWVLLNPQEAALVLGDRGYQGCGVYAQPKKNFKKPRHWWGGDAMGKENDRDCFFTSGPFFSLDVATVEFGEIHPGTRVSQDRRPQLGPLFRWLLNP